MPRIRTIKPEFWDSPSTARASAVARLAYIGMWNWADDYGRGTANMKELEGFIFPNDDLPTLSGGTSENFRRVAEEVSDCFGVVFYEVAGRPYYAIPSWDNHQRTERKAKSKFPGPDEADSPLTRDDAANEGKSRNFRRSATEDRGSSGTGTGEQGNRGTGEQGTNTRSPAPPSSTPNPGPADRFEEFWDAYPRKVGKQKARAKYAAACKRADPQAVIDGAASLRDDPNLPDAQFIPHPTTWLERDGWDDPPLPPRIGRETAADRNLQRGYQIAQRYAQQPRQPELNPFEADMKEIRA